MRHGHRLDLQRRHKHTGAERLDHERHCENTSNILGENAQRKIDIERASLPVKPMSALAVTPGRLAANARQTAWIPRPIF